MGECAGDIADSGVVLIIEVTILTRNLHAVGAQLIDGESYHPALRHIGAGFACGCDAVATKRP